MNKVALARAGMRRVEARKLAESCRNFGHGLWRWQRKALRWQQLELHAVNRVVKELLADGTAKDLGHEARHRVAKLSLAFG